MIGSRAPPAMVLASVAVHVVVALCVSADATSSSAPGGGTKLMFDAWRAEHGKHYASNAEEVRRLVIFKANVDYINAHNSRGESSVVLATNQFSDLTREEFRAAYLGRLNTDDVSRPIGGGDPTFGATAGPSAVDWVRRNGTTPVKNQGPCGGCWAFSATGALEGMEFVASGEKTGPASLSEQQLLACTVNKDYSEGGCGGGTMSNAFKYAKDHGLCGEDDMPFTAWNTTITNHSCTGVVGGEVPNCNPVLAAGKVGSVVSVPASEQGLAAAVQVQPVSIGIEADHPEFQHYGGGVFKDMGCGTKLDHGVLLVGYGQEGNQTCDPTAPGSRVCSTTQTW
jgi:C1A family cysteine protease